MNRYVWAGWRTFRPPKRLPTEHVCFGDTWQGFLNGCFRASGGKWWSTSCCPRLLIAVPAVQYCKSTHRSRLPHRRSTRIKTCQTTQFVPLTEARPPKWHPAHHSVRPGNCVSIKLISCHLAEGWLQSVFDGILGLVCERERKPRLIWKQRPSSCRGKSIRRNMSRNANGIFCPGLGFGRGPRKCSNNR